jgi:ABC-2 type transport system permease protein
VTEPARRSDLVLLRHWTAARLKSTLRTPRAAFFTIVFPLILLALLNATSGDSEVTVAGGKVSFAQYFAPSLAVYGLAVACYALPIFGLAAARDAGILKRLRGTPLSPWVYLTAWAVGAILTGLMTAVLLVVVGVTAFGVHLYPGLLPAAIVTAVLGASSLAALGLAVSTYVRRAETAPAVANLTLFPLSFLSGVFFPIQNAPAWVKAIADVFPLSHLVDAFTACFSPYTTGSGFAAGDLAVVAAWGIGGLIVAVRRFRREDERGEGEGRLRRLAHSLQHG